MKTSGSNLSSGLKIFVNNPCGAECRRPSAKIKVFTITAYQQAGTSSSFLQILFFFVRCVIVYQIILFIMLLKVMLKDTTVIFSTFSQHLR